MPKRHFCAYQTRIYTFEISLSIVIWHIQYIQMVHNASIWINSHNFGYKIIELKSFAMQTLTEKLT